MMKKTLFLILIFFCSLTFSQKLDLHKDYLFYDNKNYGAYSVSNDYSSTDFKKQESKLGNFSYTGTIKGSGIIALMINTYSAPEDRGSLYYDFYGNALQKIPLKDRESARKEIYSNIATDIKKKYNLEKLEAVGTRKNTLGQYYEYFRGSGDKEKKIFVVATFRNNYKFHFLFFFFKESTNRADNDNNISTIENFINNFGIINDYKVK